MQFSVVFLHEAFFVEMRMQHLWFTLQTAFKYNAPCSTTACESMNVWSRSILHCSLKFWNLADVFGEPQSITCTAKRIVHKWLLEAVGSCRLFVVTTFLLCCCTLSSGFCILFAFLTHSCSPVFQSLASACWAQGALADRATPLGFLVVASPFCLVHPASLLGPLVTAALASGTIFRGHPRCLSGEMNGFYCWWVINIQGAFCNTLMCLLHWHCTISHVTPSVMSCNTIYRHWNRRAVSQSGLFRYHFLRSVGFTAHEPHNAFTLRTWGSTTKSRIIGNISSYGHICLPMCLLIAANSGASIVRLSFDFVTHHHRNENIKRPLGTFSNALITVWKNLWGSLDYKFNCIFWAEHAEVV